MFDREDWSERARAALEQFQLTTFGRTIYSHETFCTLVFWVLHVSASTPVGPNSAVEDPTPSQQRSVHAAIENLRAELRDAGVDDLAEAFAVLPAVRDRFDGTGVGTWNQMAMADQVLGAFDLGAEALDVLPAWMLVDPAHRRTTPHAAVRTRRLIRDRILGMVSDRYGADVADTVPHMALTQGFTCAEVAAAAQAALR